MSESALKKLKIEARERERERESLRGKLKLPRENKWKERAK
jgi:hypothetical protein